MSYEKDIPEYALQPAKAPKNIPAEAIYNKEKITYPAEEQRMVYQFEEDILVPDTKADMREILLMDGAADLMPSQKKLTPKIDDFLAMTGTVTIQTLYNAENEETEPVSIQTRIPYKYQWELKPADQSEGLFFCQVKKLEFMIINERKFRVKISLEFTARLFCQQEMNFFDGLRDEQLQMKRRETSLTCLGLIKRDEISIDETFKGKDAAMMPESILKQNFAIAENYRQVTTEKVVINGFIFVNLLYAAVISDGDSREKVICQLNQRIEFTQFVPIEKEHRSKTWSGVRTSFAGKDLSVSIGYGEENPDDVFFHLTGEILTRIELYEKRKRHAVVDAYHREKHFACQLTRKSLSNIVDEAASETSVREIVNLPEGSKALAAVCCDVKITECQCTCEKGRVVVTGTVSAGAIWRDHEGCCHGEKLQADFRASIDLEGAVPEQKTVVRPLIKTAWLELINEKQIEINATILLRVETFETGEVVLLENPHFVDQPREKEYPMVIAAMKQGESLWDLAKRYSTTEEHIRMANHLESEPETGKRLLIIK